MSEVLPPPRQIPGMRRVEAVVAERHAVAVRVVPQVAAGQRRGAAEDRAVERERLGEELLGERDVLEVARAVASSRARRVGDRPRLVDVVAHPRRDRPAEAVGGHVGVGEEVVEQREAPRELAVVGRRVVVEQRQRRVAVALADVAEHLVVGAVLLDHVDDVPDRAERLRLGGDPRLHAVVAQDGLGQRAQALLAERRADDADAALRARPPGGGRVGEVAGRAVADRVGAGAAARAAPGGVGGGDDEPLAVARDVDVGRVPRRRDEADPLAVHEVEHGDRVLAPERDVEPLAVGGDREPVRHRAGAHAVGEPDRHRAGHALALGVDHRDRVGVAVGRVDLVAARVGGDRVRVVGELRVGRRREQDPAPAPAPCACR